MLNSLESTINSNAINVPFFVLRKWNQTKFTKKVGSLRTEIWWLPTHTAPVIHYTLGQHQVNMSTTTMYA